MDSGRPLDPSEILADALALPADQRAAFLDRACGGDLPLRAEIESLLAVNGPAKAFFERPLVMSLSGMATDAGSPGGASAPPDGWSGRTIGAWRLLERIATGGMGTVYRGERTDREFEKKVAVKLIRSGLDSEEVLVRFRLERQLLADLEHPNIGRLLDGGSTPEGLPYLVMEFVDGHPLDRYCDDQKLGVAARLQLFLTVCGAVEHAHQHLVIHRDLKPANIMVDRAGNVKLLDFGIAKVIGSDEAGNDLTVTTARRLTPRYASPEQVAGDRLSTATDIYSLGVILYELLAGRSPYPSARTPFEAEQAVQTATLVRPSQALQSDIPRTGEAAARRGTTAGKLGQQLAGDLDTIVMRALARDPHRRYPTVQALAADIRRHLTGLPVQARPDTLLYRLSRFTRRNRGLTAGVVASFVTLIGALVLTTSAYHESDRNRRKAEWLAYQNSLAAAESSIRSNQVGEAARQLATAPEAFRGWEWHHLDGRLDRSRRNWRAHAAGITRLSYLDGGRRILTASVDKTVRLWSADGDSLATLGPFDSEVESAALVKSTGEIVIGLGDGTVLLVNEANTGPPTRLGQGGSWARVDVSPDGSTIAAGYFDGQVQLWDAPTRRLEAEWKAGEKLLIPAFAPTGRTLATVSSDGRIRFWSPDGRTERTEIAAHSRRIYSVAWSHDGERLASGSMDQTVMVWKAHGDAPPGIFREHHGTITGLDFLDDGSSVLSAGADGRLLTWNPDNGGVEAELRGHTSDVSAVAVSPDGRTLASGDWAGFVRLWDRHVDDVTTLVPHQNRFLVPRIIDIRFDDAGTRLVGLTNNDDCLEWNIATRGLRKRLLKGARQAAFDSPTTILVTTSNGELVQLDTTTLDTLGTVAAHRPSEDLVLAVAAESRWIATGGPDSLVRIWSLPELKPVAVLEAGFSIRAMAASRTGGQLVAGGDGGHLVLWDARTWTPERRMEAGPSSVSQVAFYPDGGRFLTGSEDGSIRRWSVNGQSAGTPVATSPSRPYCMAISPDGRRLAIGGVDQFVRLSDLETGRELLTLHGHTGRVAGLAWSSDGRMLASAGYDGTVRLWDGPVMTSRIDQLP